LLGDDSVTLAACAHWLRERGVSIAWLKTLASSGVYAVLIGTFGLQIARVQGASMAPTLEDEDRLIVNKIVYRFREARPGDIVMFYYPVRPELWFVKRVIASGGDTVSIVDGNVFVNDSRVDDDFIPPNFRSHDDWGPQVIPEGYDFVMGDHRNSSSDSREWGMVPKKYIVGKVQVRWWPPSSVRVF
jgi:signal peptidase I